VELETDDIRIVIDGVKTDKLIIRVEANGVIYRLTDDLLELILGQVAEQFSNDYLNFHVYQP
jgi:methylmalonyl-CoA mutase N-terminal domain/subunit